MVLKNDMYQHNFCLLQSKNGSSVLLMHWAHAAIQTDSPLPAPFIFDMCDHFEEKATRPSEVKMWLRDSPCQSRPRVGSAAATTHSCVQHAASVGQVVSSAEDLLLSKIS